MKKFLPILFGFCSFWMLQCSLGLSIQSSSIAPFSMIHSQNTCPDQGGANLSPSVKITDIPANTQSLVLLIHDPDAPHTAGFVHWVVYFNNPKITQLYQNSHTKPQEGIYFGLNGLNKAEYFGPCPPKGSGVHRYNLTVYALDKKLDTTWISQADQKAIVNQLPGHVLEQAVLTAFKTAAD